MQSCTRIIRTPKKILAPDASGRGRCGEQTLIIARGNGNYVTDIHGWRMLDGIAGLWNVNVGHNRESVKQAIHRQMDELAYYQTFDGIAHPRVYDLAERLTGMFAQEDMQRVLFSSGGSDAIETALKMSRQYWIAVGEPERTRFLSLRNGYHGVHMGAPRSVGSVPINSTMGRCWRAARCWMLRGPIATRGTAKTRRP